MCRAAEWAGLHLLVALRVVLRTADPPTWLRSMIPDSDVVQLLVRSGGMLLFTG